MSENLSAGLVRRRLAASLPGLALFAIVGFYGQEDVWRQPWFFVGVGIALSVTFVEPYFGTPRAAVVNAAGAIGACVGADPGHLESLWWGLGAVNVAVFLAAVTAAITTRGPLNAACRLFSARFGRATVLGALLLVLIIVTDAHAGEPGFEWLIVATATLLASIGFDWAGLISRLSKPEQIATAIAAIGPRMLLVAAASRDFPVGKTVTVATSGGAETSGTVVARLPHADGLRYRIALADEWTQMSTGFPEAITVRPNPEAGEVVGTTIAGTTDRALAFAPFRSLVAGDSVVIRDGDRSLLYQVSDLRLEDSGWSGAQAVVGTARAYLLGWPDGSRIRAVTHLPEPHEAVLVAGGLEGHLSAGYVEIGRVKGTTVPIGIRTDIERQGHIAVLGMSGMGKTAVAKRVAEALGADHVVVALDTTGEYKTRLHFPEWDGNDLDTAGHFVYEPTGDPPEKAAAFIERCMRAGDGEYRAGRTPTRRVVLLEEAHTFLPEWNFAQRHQQDSVAFSTRMIMQARKLGVTVLLVSQRTAVVSKSGLSQCENYIILKTLDQTGLEYLESLVGPTMRAAIPRLERFEAMCVGPAFNTEAPVIIELAAP